MVKDLRTRSEGNGIVEVYLQAKEYVVKKGFGEEIDWQESIRFSQIEELDFLRESAWVVLSSGMSEAVIRRKFPSISEAFHFWRSAAYITENADNCRKKALGIFGHRGKIEAIISIAQRIFTQGFNIFKGYIKRDGVRFIRSLPFMGPATSYHLAKNIGLDVVKPDRHLLRVAFVTGFDSPETLCERIAEAVGDRISVIDLVIWRFATLNRNYVEFFAQQ